MLYYLSFQGAIPLLKRILKVSLLLILTTGVFLHKNCTLKFCHRCKLKENFIICTILGVPDGQHPSPVHNSPRHSPSSIPIHTFPSHRPPNYQQSSPGSPGKTGSGSGGDGPHFRQPGPVRRHKHLPPEKYLPRQDSRTLNLPRVKSDEKLQLAGKKKLHGNTT